MAHKRIIVNANEKIRKEKIIQRDNITEEYLELRESAGWDYRGESFDYIFENEYTNESLEEFVQKVISELEN